MPPNGTIFFAYSVIDLKVVVLEPSVASVSRVFHPSLKGFFLTIFKFLRRIHPHYFIFGVPDVRMHVLYVCYYYY